MSYEELITNYSLLLNEKGEWPVFHDAEILSVNCCSMVSEDDGKGYAYLTIGPTLAITLELCAEENPYVVTLQFSGCINVNMNNFGYVNDINDLSIDIQERGTFTNGEPLPPYLVVNFEKLSYGLNFKCFEIEAVSRLNESLLGCE